MTRYILITGASSGIGRTTALMLAENGFTVFAGVRKEQDALDIKRENIIPVFIDVTDERLVGEAFGTIEETVGESGLYALVNNAGIAVAGPMEFLPIEKLRHQLEINVIGQVRVTQTFLPLVRKAHGRIVNISSIAGFTAFPFKGAYSASKHAFEAVSDSLRRELKQWDIQVSLVQPGIVKTPIWNRSLELFSQTICEMDEYARNYYGNYCDPLIEKMKKKVEKLAIPSERVAESVFKALNDKNPKTRYLVGKDAHLLNLLRFLPDKILDGILCSHLKLK